MRYWGISALSHDASLAVVETDRLLFASHSERYSRKKNDPLLHNGLIREALCYGPPDTIVSERPLLKKMRHMRAGQWNNARSSEDLPRRYLASIGLPFPLPDIVYVDHHSSHAAAGFATSGFREAAVIVADSIGEFRTFTIGHYDIDGKFRTLHHRSYPHSLGLLYSAFTKRCGFHPNEDEHIVMGMAAYGRPLYVDAIHEDFLDVAIPTFRLKSNVHRESGIGSLGRLRKTWLLAYKVL